MPAHTIAVLHGDQTGEELLREALRLLEPDVLGVKVETRDFDLSLEERRRTRNQCVLDAASALRELGFGIKAATITPTSPAITASKPRKPRDWMARIPKAANAVMTPATKRGTPGKSR